MRDARKGFSLMEAILALFLLVSAFLVITNLLHTALRFGTKAAGPVYATTIAGRRVEEVRRWAWSRVAGAYNFDGDWSPITTTQQDDENPEYQIHTEVSDAPIFSPCTSLEASVPEGQRKRLPASARRIRVVVTWDSSDPSRSVSLVGLIREPPRTFRAESPLVVSATAPLSGPLARDESASFTVEAYDEDDRRVEGLMFRWYLETMTGNGTLSQSRDGLQAALTHRVRMRDGRAGYAPGTCRLRVRAVLRGNERWAETPLLELAR